MINKLNIMALTEQDLIATIRGEETQPTEPQQPETPVTETPQPTPQPTPEVQDNTPKAPEPPVQPTFNLDEELLKISGGALKSKDELVSLLDKTKSYADLESKVKTYEEENTSLKAKANTDPFASDYVKKLNDLYKSGANENQISAFVTLNKAGELDKLSPLEAKQMALQIKHGLSSEEASNYLKSSYKLDPAEYDEETIKSETIRLKVDSQSDVEFLKSHKAEVSKLPENPVETQQKQLEQQRLDHLSKIEPIAKNAVHQVIFKESINGKSGEDANLLDLPLSETSKAEVEATVRDWVNSNWQFIPNTEEGAKSIKEFAENVYVLKNWRNWLVEAANTREKQVLEQFHNPTNIKRGDDNPAPVKTQREEVAEGLLEYIRQR